MDQEFIDVLGTAEVLTFEPPPSGRTGDLLETEDAGLAIDRVPIAIPAAGNSPVIPPQLDGTYRLPEVAPRDADALATYGTEAIACYVSFHFRRRSWGIYLSQRRLEALARTAFGGLTHYSDAERLMAAYEFVLDHERFHYWTDVAASQIEMAAKVPMYVPYVTRHPSVHGSALARAEEGLANARARGRLRDKDVRLAAESFMSRQPPGYRDWKKYAGPKRFAAGKRELGAGVRSSAMSPWLAALPFEWFFDEHRTGASAARIPLHWISDAPAGWAFIAAYARPIHVVESERFASAVRRLPKEVERMWREKTKPQLETGNWSGTDFKKLHGRPDTYRCRVGLGHRVHLRRTTPDTFEAVEIGTRQSM